MNSNDIVSKLWQRNPDGLLIVNEHQSIVAANPQIEKLLGYQHGGLIGKDLSVIIPKNHRDAHRRQTAKYFEDPVIRPMGLKLDLSAEKSDGTEVPVEISLSPVSAQNGARCVIAAVRDVTMRREMEKELKKRAQLLAESNEDLEQFAYVASHDLQEPLRMISMHLQLFMRDNTNLPLHSQESLNYVIKEADRMRELIRDVLTYSRLNATADVVPLDCNKLVNEVLIRLGRAVEESYAEILVTPLPFIFGNRAQVSILFQNLIENSIKYRSAAPPKISVSVKDLSNYWQFTVKDNGIGIDPQFYDRIFLMFKRLQGRNTKEGNGIGLALCKKIVDRNGGKIWVESTPEKGSEFHFTWPKEK